METTHSIWNIIDDEEVLLPYKGDGMNTKNCILFEISSDDEDGTYPRVSDYVRYANSLEKDGVSYFLNRLSRKKDKKIVEIEGIKIIRESNYGSKAIIEFPKPIQVIMGYVGKKPIIENVKRIQGEFTYDWFWSKNGRQNKIANGFEIWLNIQKYLE